MICLVASHLGHLGDMPMGRQSNGIQNRQFLNLTLTLNQNFVSQSPIFLQNLLLPSWSVAQMTAHQKTSFFLWYNIQLEWTNRIHLLTQTQVLLFPQEHWATRFRHLVRSLAIIMASSQLSATPIILRSSRSVSCHVFLGLPLRLFPPSGIHCNAVLAGLDGGSLVYVQ